MIIKKNKKEAAVSVTNEWAVKTVSKKLSALNRLKCQE